MPHDHFPVAMINVQEKALCDLCKGDFSVCGKELIAI